MRLYVLLSGIDYEGDTLEGVYSTIEEARAAAVACDSYCDSMTVAEVELGQPANRHDQWTAEVHGSLGHPPRDLGDWKRSII